MDKKRALGQVKRMIVSSPSMPDLYDRLACEFIRSGKHAEALRTVESQFHLQNSLNSLYSTAWLFVWLKVINQAIGNIGKNFLNLYCN